jgi:Ca-activated chloride channel family protein
MTFLRPLALLGLVGIPILVAVYARHQADRRAAAAVFAAPHMTDSVTPNRPGFRRHLPLVAVLVALTALVVAAARPAHSVAESVRHASIMLATDVSSSMAAKDVAPNRLKAAARAAGSFAAKVPSSLSVGVIAFNQSPVLLQSPTTDRSQIRPQLDSLRPRGGTATGKAIALATRVINGTPKINGKRPPGAIVLLSDGKSTFGLNPITAAQAAKKLHIPIYTVALGTASGTIDVPNTNGQGTHTETVPPSPETLGQIARASGGKAYTAASATHLSEIYKTLGYQLGHHKVKHELTSGFAGGALLLVALASFMSLRWFGRLI